MDFYERLTDTVSMSIESVTPDCKRLFKFMVWDRRDDSEVTFLITDDELTNLINKIGDEL